MGEEELQWHQLAHHHLMSLQGPHFSLHSKAKADAKSTNVRKNGISDLAFASVYREKTRLKKCLIMIIITCLPPFFNINEKRKYRCLNHCHNVCTINDKDTKLTSLFLQMSLL